MSPFSVKLLSAAGLEKRSCSEEHEASVAVRASIENTKTAAKQTQASTFLLSITLSPFMETLFNYSRFMIFKTSTKK